ncbi:S1 family peptidase [Aurantiacibacter poecillastricola]|uniref:S1 family peptidase n=1 Tax=Aurantiacibacter poecillastricola TaxID=3064385 RepID=UPI0027400622|nr:serine protease [Aurantiacibacter sp. 219JJ12-13]MDP5262605.1 serine protease [Aurantiacibacter sp. 219JJ12-13]
MHRLLAILALLLAALAATPRPALAEAADIEAAARGVVRVIIIGEDGDEIFPVSHGTGFAVGGERIVTNAHVVAEAIEDERLSIGIVPAEGQQAVYARLVAVSPRNDLALLELTEPLGLPPLTIAGNPANSGAVTAVGYPLNVDKAQGLQQSDIFRAQPPVTATGFLSGRRPSREFDTILHTAPIARGNSGGPLLDDCGRVVGVNSFGTESAGSDAEFFFAVSTRELLPFLRANDVQPRINSLACRSLDDLEAEEIARAEREAEMEAERAEREAEALAQQTAEARRTITYEVMDIRATRMAFALLLLIIAVGAAGIAFYGHERGDMRLRAIAGAIAVLALVGAIIAWITRPDFAVIDEMVQERLRSGLEDGPTGTIAAPQDTSSPAASLTCVLDTSRSRVVGDPEEDIVVEWSGDGCINGRTQYGLTGERWTRVFVPANEAAVSVNRFDPDEGELVMERYLLDLGQMRDARAARGNFVAPDCGVDETAAREFGSSQGAIMSSLPQRPNERLVYSCSTSAPEPAPEQEGAE